MVKRLLHMLLATLGLGGSAFAATPAELPGLTDRIWVAAGADALPGTTRLFRSNGTLVRESGAGGFHLDHWESLASGQLHWHEDGIDVLAHIDRLTERELVLTLNVVSGPITHRYVAADSLSARASHAA